jgi:hypothetical protein
MAAGEGTIIVDGSVNWDQGVDSISVTSAQTAANPDGMPRSRLAWLDNATTRDGGITQRFGWKWKGRIHDGSALYGGGFMYSPPVQNAYPILCIGGHIIRLDPDFATPPIDLSALWGVSNPSNAFHCYFCQAEQFLIIQPGIGPTNPLFYNENATPQLWRSIGITDPAMVTPANHVNEIPNAGAMVYYQNRVWYAIGRTYMAGDILGNRNSGTAFYNYRDSVLNVTENPLCFGGDGFTIPTAAGNITALSFNANLNTTLGQDQLIIGTHKIVYAMAVPVTRADWINATSQNQPRQTVVHQVNGPVNDRCIVQANGDVFFQTLEPGITSLFTAIRDFQTWGNHALSADEDRVLAFTDRKLLSEVSGIVFDNRMFQTVMPKQTPVGLAYQAIIPCDFVPISEFETGETRPPNWEGIYEGLNVLQLLVGDFGGYERAFAVTVSDIDGGIDLWEITDYLESDYQNPAIGGHDGEARVTWIAEFPAFNWMRDFDLKRLVGGELWVDKLYGEVVFKVEYRPDSDPCWRFWTEWKECQPRTSLEELPPPSVTYPLQQCRQGFRAVRTLPKPPVLCESNTGRPSDIAYQHQIRITVKGYARIRGLLLYATPVERKTYLNMVGS